MLRTLVVLATAAAGIALFVMGGRVGPIDLTDFPPALLAFCAMTGVVLVGLRHI